jgi:hypothetical protein
VHCRRGGRPRRHQFQYDADGGNGGAGGAGGKGGGYLQLRVYELNNLYVIEANGQDGFPGGDAPDDDASCGAQYTSFDDGINVGDMAGGGGGGGSGGDGGDGGTIEISYAFLVNGGTIQTLGGQAGAAGLGGAGGGCLTTGMANGATVGPCFSCDPPSPWGLGGPAADEFDECGGDGAPGTQGSTGANGTISIQQILVDDCNSNCLEDFCEVANGDAPDCNDNDVPDECDPDCDGDGIPDDCEADCNGDGIPDDCDPDCNGNGNSDSCDIVDGSSDDINGNWIPDECDDEGVYINEDFDDYDLASAITDQSSWEAWDDDPVTIGFVTDTVSRSSPQALEITDPVNLVHNLGTLTGGAYLFTAWVYVPGDFDSNSIDLFAGSYFNLLSIYEHAGPYHWAVQMQFDSNDGMLKVYDGTIFFPTPYLPDTWVEISCDIDLNDDWVQVVYDGLLMAEYSWSVGIQGDGGGSSASRTSWCCWAPGARTPATRPTSTAMISWASPTS